MQILSSDSSKEGECEVDGLRFHEHDLRGLVDSAKEILQGGPGVLYLSLVDLSEFYPSQLDNEPAANQQTVNRLMERYMAKGSILAIVPAYDASSQKILLEVKRYDQDKRRMLRTITKPDRLAPDSKDEKNFMRCVQNTNEPAYTPAWSWYILRNRSGVEVSHMREQRDQKESFFQSSS